MEDHASKFKGLIWVGVACAFGIFFAVGVRPFAHAIPWSWEKKLGKAVQMDMNGKDCPYNSEADALLQRLVKRIYPLTQDDKDFSIEVKIVKDPVVNAYASLGGKIMLNSGLLRKAESPEEIAGVLAHEIEHVHHRHIMEGALVHLFTAEGINVIFGSGTSAASFAKFIFNMDFTRSQETQADEEGLRRLQKAHVDNQGFKRFFERMEKESGSVFLSDHPSSRARMEMTERFKNEATKPIMTLAEWGVLKNCCGEK